MMKKNDLLSFLCISVMLGFLPYGSPLAKAQYRGVLHSFYNVRAIEIAQKEKTPSPLPEKKESFLDGRNSNNEQQKNLKELAGVLSKTHQLQLTIRLEQEMETLRQSALKPMTKALLRSANRNMEKGKFPAAMDDLNSALLLQPDSALLYRQRAQLFSAGGQTEPALVDLARAIHMDDKDVLAWDLLSTVEEQKSDMMASYKAWKRVLMLSPGHEEGKSRLNSLHIKAFGQAL